MFDSVSLFLVGLVAAAATVALGALLVRASGARAGLARRLAGASQLRVGELFDLSELPPRPIRVTGRIRCPEPILTADEDRLVALHRDVQVQLGDGSWRTIERLRETRGFELWDHDGSLPVDPAEAAEPLVAIPHVWRGTAEQLEHDAHRAAVERLLSQGLQPGAARSVTRMVSVVERLLVLAEVRRDALGRPFLAPPPGGFVISTLDLPDAMRLLGGPRKRLLLAGAAVMGLGILVGAVSLIAGLLLG